MRSFVCADARSGQNAAPSIERAAGAKDRAAVVIDRVPIDVSRTHRSLLDQRSVDRASMLLNQSG